MNKQVEQIKTEIERRLSVMPKSAWGTDELKRLLSFIDSLQEESKPNFKIGQKITDGKETVIVSELLDDGSIRVDTKPSGDCWFDIDVNEADKWRLVEEPISEDLLDEIHNRWEDDPHTKWPKCPYKDFKNIACHFANWQKEQYINEGISPKDAYFGHLLEESWANGRLSGIHEHKQQMMKDFSIWKRSGKLIEGALLDRGILYIPRYMIELSELKKLPKEE